MEPTEELLKLSNQLCFPFYAVSRLITRAYSPMLEKLGITYPQYLALLVLWEEDGLTVKQIAKQLLLNTNTLTPLLKRMENQELILRKRSMEDERKVFIHLTEKGREMKKEALQIPANLIEDMDYPLDQLMDLKKQIDLFFHHLAKEKK